MAEETKPDEEPVETPKEEPKDDGYDYRADHNRDIRAIAKDPVLPEKPAEEGKPEGDSKPNESMADTPSVGEEKSGTPAPVKNPLDEAKEYLAEQRKAATEAAKQAAKDSVKEELTRTKEESAREAKEKDEMIPLWEKEGRAPKDYDEIAKENRRITKLELKQELKAEQEATKQAKELELQSTAKQSEEALEAANSRIGRDMRDLYEGGYLPAIKTPGDANDPGEKAKQALFQLGVEHNIKLKEAGKDPEPSIAKIFFMNKDKIIAKPVQPAGADAPVSGSRPAVIKQESEGYEYAKDHKKTFRQIATEEARRKAS